MKCDYFTQNICRSCSYLDQDYDYTLKTKQSHLSKLFSDYQYKLLEPVGLSAGVEHSRHKLKLAASSYGDEVVFGIFDASAHFTKLEHCPLHRPVLNSLLSHLKPLLKKYSISPYDVHTRKGELKFVILTSEQGTDEILLRFVLRSKESLDRLKKLVSDLGTIEPLVRVASANIQPEPKAILEGEEEIVLSKQDYLVHSFDGIKLAQGGRSFFQVTPEIAKKLYASLSDELAKRPAQKVLDLFCGVGAFAFHAAKSCSDVTGVEISKEAIECAKISNQLNNTAINFFASDAHLYLAKSRGHFDAVIVNPPRRGLKEALCQSLIALEASTIYYSSCNAHSLLQDYESLKPHYQLAQMQLFDMFPYTEHFETFAIFHRKN